MKTLCPICHTEMLERSNIHVCPRNEIGDCSYDAHNLANEDLAYVLDRSNHYSDLRSCSVPDSK